MPDFKNIFGDLSNKIKGMLNKGKQGKTESHQEIAEMQISIGGPAGGGASSQEMEELKKQLSATANRIAEFETNVQKMDDKISKLNKSSEEHKARLEELDSRMLEMMSIYEVVSNQMNPFVGASEMNKGLVEEIKKELDQTKSRLLGVEKDLGLLIKARVNISKLVRTAIQTKVEEEKRKTDLGKLIKTAINDRE